MQLSVYDIVYFIALALYIIISINFRITVWILQKEEQMFSENDNGNNLE